MTGDDIRAVADLLDPSFNSESISRFYDAAKSLDAGDIIAAHTTVCDVITSRAVSGQELTGDMFDIETGLLAQRVKTTGPVGRPVDQSAPNLTGGW